MAANQNSNRNRGNQNSGNRNGNSKKRKNRKRRRIIKIVVFFIEIIVLFLVLGALYVSLKMSKINTGEKIDENDRHVNESLKPGTIDVMDKYRTIALFGLDNRSTGNLDQGNSDVIIVCSINEKTKEVKMASVYRDTYLDIGGDKGYRKANAAFAYGGPTQAINMLNRNLDLDIKDYVVVDFKAVAETIDLLGGVEITINNQEAEAMIGFIEEVARLSKKPANYLRKGGTYLMDGVQATAYCRVRQTAGSDFKRTERQREVIGKMVEKALHSDLGTINSIIDEVFPLIKTSLNQWEILDLAKDAFSYSLGENTGFPYETQTKHMPKSSYSEVPVDLADNVRRLHEFLYENQEYEVSDEVQRISDDLIQKTGVKPAPASTEQ